MQVRTEATYLVNDPQRPLRYGQAELHNTPRRRLRGRPEREGILAETVIAGFCGTDFSLMRMGARGELSPKFPRGLSRLINGHEGVVWVPSQRRFAIVLIRGGDSYDPTRFSEDESYFEYGCDGADGLFSDCGYYNPEMLLPIPDGLAEGDRLPIDIAKRLVFPDPYACMLFQLERMEDLGAAQMFRVEMARRGCGREEAWAAALEHLFDRTVIFGLGATGLFMGDVIRRSHPGARVVYVARSPEDSAKVRFAEQVTGGRYVRSAFDTPQALAGAIEEELGGKAGVFVGASGSAVEQSVAFDCGLLGCNGIYNSFSLGPRLSFDTMPFGFRSNIVVSAVNFRQAHMERAIELLPHSRFDEIVELIDRDELARDPMAAYEQRIYAPGAPLKTAVVWNAAHIKF